MISTELPTPDPRTFDDDTRPFAEAVSGQFAIKRLIGRGGMGMVFLARDRRLDRLVAIKTLPPSLANDRDVRERFLRETRTAGSLSHANIVPIHGADEIGGFVFFVMSYVDGDSLAAHTRDKGKLPAPAVGRYLRDVAAALSHAHQRSIVHRDIKAENILIDRVTDRALVTDFGIARVAESTPLTVTGQVLGTVHYVSPEQVSGEFVDARSDIYSLGVVGFLALTGRFPFNADVASAVLVQHVTRTAPPVASVNRNVPAALASIIDRCLMKDPAHRYGSADELSAALESAMPTLDQKPVVVSDTAAHAVWQRAAEMQAHTGMQPRPEAVKQKPTTPRPKSASSGPGFRVDEVVAAASEAGIDERYVERALEERGLVPRPQEFASPTTLPVATPRPDAKRRPWWSLARLDTVFTTTVKGELPARDVERLLNTLRDQTNTVGTTLARTRELAWYTGTLSSRLEVSVVPAEGQTTVSMVRSVRHRTVGALLALSLVIALFAGVSLGVFIAEATREEELGAFVGFGFGLAVTAMSFRVLVRNLRERATQRLTALGDVIATKVRDSIR